MSATCTPICRAPSGKASIRLVAATNGFRVCGAATGFQARLGESAEQHRELGPRRHTELAADLSHGTLYRWRGQRERACDLGIRLPRDDRGGQPHFGRGQ